MFAQLPRRTGRFHYFTGGGGNGEGVFDQRLQRIFALKTFKIKDFGLEGEREWGGGHEKPGAK